MILLKTKKDLKYGEFVGKSRIDGKNIYKFESYLEFKMHNYLPNDLDTVSILEDELPMIHSFSEENKLTL